MGGLGGAMVDIVTPFCSPLAQSFDERQGVFEQYVTARFQKDINGSKPQDTATPSMPAAAAV